MVTQFLSLIRKPMVASAAVAFILLLTEGANAAEHIPYQYQANATGDCTTACGFIFPTVPAGHLFVVQRLSGLFRFNANPTAVLVNVYSHDAGFVSEHFFAPFDPVFFTSAFNEATLIYVNAGQQLEVVVGAITLSSQIAPSLNQVTAIGYFLDCDKKEDCPQIAP